jgi:hypothetical protein
MQIDIIGQINREQLLKTLRNAGIAALVAVLIVVESDLPRFVDATAPLGVFIGFAIAQVRKYLESGAIVGSK